MTPEKIKAVTGLIKGMIATVLVLILTTPVLAATALDRLTGVGTGAGFTGTTGGSLPLVIGNIIKGVLSLLGVVFMAYIIYAGWLRVIASGDAEKLKKSGTIIRGSIIGLILVLSAYAITAFVVSRFTTTGIYNDGAVQATTK